MIIGREKILELIKNKEIVIEPFEDKKRRGGFNRPQAW